MAGSTLTGNLRAKASLILNIARSVLVPCRISGTGRLSSDQAQDLEYLTGMRAELHVDALDADRSRAVNDHEGHLRDSGHSTHRLTPLGQQVVLPSHVEAPVKEHGHRDSRDLLELPRIIAPVAVDDVQVGLLS